LILNSQSLRSLSGGDRESVWKSLKSASAAYAIPSGSRALHAACSIAKPAASEAQNPVAHNGWREGLKSLYCQTLARSIAGAVFSYGRYAPNQNANRFGEPSALSPTDVLPSSWLNLGASPAPRHVERLRAAIIQRLEVANRPSPVQRPSAGRHTLILDKAA
jgi:hypothetical protein